MKLRHSHYLRRYADKQSIVRDPRFQRLIEGWSSRERVPRPTNSFLLFRSFFPRHFKVWWKRLSREEKRPWKEAADELRCRHTAMFPEYRYRPRHRPKSDGHKHKAKLLVSQDIARSGNSTRPHETGFLPMLDPSPGPQIATRMTMDAGTPMNMPRLNRASMESHRIGSSPIAAGGSRDAQPRPSGILEQRRRSLNEWSTLATKTAAVAPASKIVIDSDSHTEEYFWDRLGQALFEALLNVEGPPVPLNPSSCASDSAQAQACSASSKEPQYQTSPLSSSPYWIPQAQIAYQLEPPFYWQLPPPASALAGAPGPPSPTPTLCSTDGCDRSEASWSESDIDAVAAILLDAELPDTTPPPALDGPSWDDVFDFSEPSAPRPHTSRSAHSSALSCGSGGGELYALSPVFSWSPHANTASEQK
ncbi:hypothetical protein OE88DRAFT_1420858 [Heliocybe sulcata]|uniref:HMG box domain-containing protein n=1 Tax=Heliocybe sulcata TaxID=5364 RepID=A0A5C3N473_9AGAM|nr:hypothetical protein OE88DRAFT_1420858 [Heliocybe sulcata]